MKKRRATKDDNDVPLDVRREIEAMYYALGGRPGLIKYGKNHETWAYNKVMDTMTTQIAAQVDVHATIHDGEAARQKLQDAFVRLIEARDLEKGTVIVNDEVVYRDPARITDAARGTGQSSIADQSSDADRTTIDARPATQDDTSPTRLHDEPKRAADPSARGTGHATTDQRPPSTDDGREGQNKNFRNPENEGSPLCGGPSVRTTVHAQPVSAAPRAPTTTDLYYEYMNSGGGHRTRWDNNQ